MIKVQGMWYLIDAKGKVLGRLATGIVPILRGKNKASFTPNLDGGDHVIVVNADKIVVTGKKKEDKEYFSHSGFPGGVKFIKLEQLMADKPGEVLMKAVKGMMPKNRLSRGMLRRLKIYCGENHSHSAQKPVVIDG